MASETRIIDIPQDAVLAADVSSLVRVFSQIAAQPDDAKHVRGTIFVGFPFYEDDPRPNWAISEIRQYVRKLDEALPYFPYFLARDPALGHVLMYLLCLIPIADLEARRYSSLELMQAVKRKRAAVADFCDRIQDDADRATEPLLLNLPPTIAKADPNLVARILAVMRLPLVGLETQLAAGSVDTPEMKEHLDEVLTKATALAGLDRSSYKSDLEVLRALLARITPSVSREELSEFEQAFERALELVPGRKYRVRPNGGAKACRRTAKRCVPVRQGSHYDGRKPARLSSTGRHSRFRHPRCVRRSKRFAADRASGRRTGCG